MTEAKRGPAMQQINVDIVNHVAKYGPCGFIELYDLFGGCKALDGKNTLESFRVRLKHLTYRKRLVAVGTRTHRRWRAPLEDAEPSPQPLWAGVVVPPPQHDVMHGPTYVPERAPVMRPGSQDFKRCASHGDRC